MNSFQTGASRQRTARFKVFACFCFVMLSSCATDNTDNDIKLAFLAFGDSGYITERPNGSGLLPVAGAMRRICQETECKFAVMAGDNIYPVGADGNPESDADKERFRRVFSEPFGDFANIDDNFRTYVALGNHDWLTSRAGAMAQIAYHEESRPFHMDGPFYSVRPPAGDGKVEIFVIDTEMLLAPLPLDEVVIADDGSVALTGARFAGGTANALPQTEHEQRQFEWLENALRTSRADWKIVLAHYPLWESKGSKFEQSVALRAMLAPVLCQYADFYIAGHQHTLELHEDSCETALPGKQVEPLAHLVSGAAAKARTINPAFMGWQADNYPQLTTYWAQGAAWGYAIVELDGDEMTIRIIATKSGEPAPNEFEQVFSHRFRNRDDIAGK